MLGYRMLKVISHGTDKRERRKGGGGYICFETYNEYSPD